MPQSTSGSPGSVPNPFALKSFYIVFLWSTGLSQLGY